VTDHLDPERRSENMRRVKGRDTEPEHLVRRALHAMGRRFRLHRRDLPGRPDIVLSKDRLVIFVHGCFWHRHEGCSRTTMPSSRRDFWEAKFNRTIARDAEQIATLGAMGWRTEIVWECEARRPAILETRLREILS
jgi:DNA mismatch endonuclease (patch repair protein)